MNIQEIIKTTNFKTRQESQMQGRIIKCVSDNVCYIMGFEDGYLDFTVPHTASLQEVIEGRVSVTVDLSDENNTLTEQERADAIRFFREALIEFAKKN